MHRQLVPFPASPAIVDKLKVKHGVEWKEIEEVFRNYPRFFLSTIADQYGESRYDALGRTEAGRYLTVFFVPVAPNRAKIISARNMKSKERRRYRRK
ncbi:MAG: BrnT family toxin [bacterium]|nr:BrnT family toxin [bacterium]